MKKFFAILFLALGLFVVSGAEASAHGHTSVGYNSGGMGTGTSGAGGSNLHHSFQPHVDTVTGEMIARVDNWGSQPTSNLVCVEADNTYTGVRTHLGCLTVNLEAMWSSGNWASQFGAPVNTLPAGNYRVSYNTQNASGYWYSITHHGYYQN